MSDTVLTENVAMISLTRKEAANLLLASITMDELGLSEILNAEKGKIQQLIDASSPSELKDVDSIRESVRTLVSRILRKEFAPPSPTVGSESPAEPASPVDPHSGALNLGQADLAATPPLPSSTAVIPPQPSQPFVNSNPLLMDPNGGALKLGATPPQELDSLISAGTATTSPPVHLDTPAAPASLPSVGLFGALATGENYLPRDLPVVMSPLRTIIGSNISFSGTDTIHLQSGLYAVTYSITGQLCGSDPMLAAELLMDNISVFGSFIHAGGPDASTTENPPALRLSNQLVLQVSGASTLQLVPRLAPVVLNQGTIAATQVLPLQPTLATLTVYQLA